MSLAPGPLEQSTAAVVAGNPLPRQAGRVRPASSRESAAPNHAATPWQIGDAPPYVFVEKIRGALRIAALTPEAVNAGLSPGQDLASARALFPELAVIDHDPGADRRWLERIVDSCERFTPIYAVDAPDCVVLDITGVAHLWGGEVALTEAVEAQFARLHIRIGTAASPEAAAALARFATEPGQTTLGTLPIAALRLDDSVEIALRRAGLLTIGDLSGRPTAPLAARFGATTVFTLDRLLGRIDSRLTPRRHAPALVVTRRFAEPIARTETALGVLDELLAEAAAELDRRGRGGRRFAARFYRSDNATFDLAVETGLPSRDPATIARLFRERIDALSDPIDPGFGFDQIRLAVPVLEPLAVEQLALEGGQVAEEELAALVDRLSTRLGRGRVRRLAPRDTHIPEQAAFTFPAHDARKADPWTAPEAGEPPLRPLHLFDPPQPIQVTAAGVPDGPPAVFRWRRSEHAVARHEGPERIASEWWQLRPGTRLTRDYYRVEDVRGRRFWIFRHGLFGSEAEAPRWYLHGLFA